MIDEEEHWPWKLLSEKVAEMDVMHAHEKTYNIAIQRIDMPARIRKLPVSDNGFPVPKFVEWVNGQPDFRVIKDAFKLTAIRLKLCWLCGEPLGRHQAFVLGPMCSITKTTSEPPSHLECAQFAVKACPFLTQPNRKRNEHDLPEAAEEPGGIMIARNPGVSAIWVTESYKVFQARGAPGGGHLITVGEPSLVEWYARGRTATRAEIMHSIDTGLPALQDMARREGREAITALAKQIARGLALVPE